MDLNRGRLHLLIVAAGSGRRMGAEGNKLLLPLQGRPLLAWTLESALASESIAWLGVVGQPCDREAIEALLQPLQPRQPWCWIQGEPRVSNRWPAVWRRFPQMLSTS